MAEFFIVVGVLGLVTSTIVLFSFWQDNNHLLIPALAWGAFFGLVTIGLYEIENQVPPKPETVQSLALKEYERCINVYDRNLVLKNIKITEEQLCSNLNVIYKRQVLDNVKSK